MRYHRQSNYRHRRSAGAHPGEQEPEVYQEIGDLKGLRQMSAPHRTQSTHTHPASRRLLTPRERFFWWYSLTCSSWDLSGSSSGRSWPDAQAGRRPYGIRSRHALPKPGISGSRDGSDGP